MRRVIKTFKAHLCVLVLTLAMIFISASCDYVGGEIPTPSTDSTYIAEDIDAMWNPSLTTVSEVLLLQKRLAEEYDVDQELCSMPEDLLVTVSKVCLNKYGTVKKKDIVDEYRANISVYNNMYSPQQNTQQKDSAVVEGQPVTIDVKPVSTSYYYEIDTIDGKPIKMLIKQEKYESK